MYRETGDCMDKEAFGCCQTENFGEKVMRVSHTVSDLVLSITSATKVYISVCMCVREKQSDGEKEKTQKVMSGGGETSLGCYGNAAHLEHVAGDTIDTHIWQLLPVKWPSVQTDPTDACFPTRILSQTVLT